MTFIVEVQRIESSITRFEDEDEGTAFIDSTIDKAVADHVFTQIDVWRMDGAHECGWTVHEDGTIDI